MITFSELGKAGRLGNQLWQIASTLGIAYTLNDKVSLPCWDYQEFFCVPGELFSGARGRESWDTELTSHIDLRERIYLQDYGLWKDIEPRIREYFQPSKKGMEALQEYQSFWNLEPPVLAIHVRRGDYLENPKLFPLPTPEYFEKAMDQIDYNSIVVFSDDIPWCRKYFGSGVFYFEGAPRPKVGYETAPILDWIDMQLMAFCDYHIIANSTYSWWGAYLSDNSSPVYPDPWWGSALSHIDSSLMFPDDWTSVKC